MSMYHFLKAYDDWMSKYGTFSPSLDRLMYLFGRVAPDCCFGQSINGSLVCFLCGVFFTEDHPPGRLEQGGVTEGQCMSIKYRSFVYPSFCCSTADLFVENRRTDVPSSLCIQAVLDRNVVVNEDG